MKKRVSTLFALLVFLIAGAVSADLDLVPHEGNSFKQIMVSAAPLNNCTIILTDGCFTVTRNTRADGYAHFIGFEGLNLTFYYNDENIANMTIPSNDYLFSYNVSGTIQPLQNFRLALHEDGTDLLLMASGTMPTDIVSFFSLSTITDYWRVHWWGDLMYGLLALLPISYYIKSRNDLLGASVITLLLGAIGVTVSADIAVFFYLLIATADRKSVV